MFLRIENLAEKKLIGQHLQTSHTKNRTFELWNKFMPRKKEIKNLIGSELYSVEVYPANHFVNFNPANEFEKWAAIEVTDFNTAPAEMETLTIPTGLYAVFLHKGPAKEGALTYNYIFMDWLPKSDYVLDHRPHFAVMGEKYKNDDPSSEEEIWIPVRKK